MPSLDLGQVVGAQGPAGPAAQGTMAAATYDPQGKATDVYAYADGKASAPHASRHANGGSDPVTPAAIGAAPAAHTHGAGDIASGTMPVARGGTGRGSFMANQLLYASGNAAIGQMAFPSEENSVLTQGPSGTPAWKTPAQMSALLNAARIVPFQVYLDTKTSRNNYQQVITENAGIKMVVPIRCTLIEGSRRTFLIPSGDSYSDAAYLYGLLLPGQTAAFGGLDVNENQPMNHGTAVLLYGDNTENCSVGLSADGVTLEFQCQNLKDYSYKYHFGGFYIV